VHFNRLRHSGAGLGARIAMMLALCLCAMDAFGGPRALIVLSSGSSQFQQCASNASKVLGQVDDIEIVIKELSDIVQSDLDSLGAGDVCLVVGAKAAVGIGRKLDPEIPMVYAMVSNPGGLGLESRANTVGISADVSPEDQFAIMKQVYGGVKRVGVLYSSGSSRSMKILDQARRELPEGWVLEAVDMDAYSSVSMGVDALIRLKVDFVWMISDPKVYSAATVKTLLIASIKYKLRVFAFSPQVVKAGAIVGIGVDPAEQGEWGGLLSVEVVKNGMQSAQRKSVSIHVPVALNKIVAERIGVELSKTLIQEAEYLYD